MDQHDGASAAETEKRELHADLSRLEFFCWLIEDNPDLDPEYIFGMADRYRDRHQQPIEAKNWYYSSDCTPYTVCVYVAGELTLWRKGFGNLVDTLESWSPGHGRAFAMLDDTIEYADRKFQLALRMDALVEVKRSHIQTFLHGIANSLVGSFTTWSQRNADRSHHAIRRVLVNMDTLERDFLEELERSEDPLCVKKRADWIETLQYWTAKAAQASTPSMASLSG